MFIGFNLRMQIECWTWLIPKYVTHVDAAREASGHCVVGGTVLVIVWYWQTRLVPTHAQSCYSARLLCHGTVTGRRTNVDIEVEFRKGLWVHSSCFMQVFMKRLTPSLHYSERKMFWLDTTQRPLSLHSAFCSLINTPTHACTHTHTHIYIHIYII